MDVGIAEEHAAAFASGLAKGGMRPFWGVMTSFMQRAFDQIQQDIAINNNPAVIGIFGSTLWGTNDVTHLCWFDIPMISNIPNVVMLAPADRTEYMSMLKWALDQTKHPVAIRVPAIPVADLDIPVSDTYDDLNTFQQVRAGHGVAIIAVGNMLGNALKAADILKADGYEPTVINPRFLSGLDAEMLSSPTTRPLSPWRTDASTAASDRKWPPSTATARCWCVIWASPRNSSMCTTARPSPSPAA